MRQYLVLFLILMIPFMPFASQDVEGDIVATSAILTIEYHGESDNVSILGEWDWGLSLIHISEPTRPY